MAAIPGRAHHRDDATDPPPHHLFEDWLRWWSLRVDPEWRDELIRVDEYQDGDEHVIRAELPGIDPAKDLEITLDGGTLHLTAHRTSSPHEGNEFIRRELRRGMLVRDLPVGQVSPDDIAAHYRDGILEIRLPIPGTAKSAAARIPVVPG